MATTTATAMMTAISSSSAEYRHALRARHGGGDVKKLHHHHNHRYHRPQRPHDNYKYTHYQLLQQHSDQQLQHDHTLFDGKIIPKLLQLEEQMKQQNLRADQIATLHQELAMLQEEIAQIENSRQYDEELIKRCATRNTLYREEMTKIYERIRTLWAFYNKKKVDSSVDNRMGLQRNLEASSAASIVDPYSLSNHEGTYVYYPLSDLKKSPDDDPHRTMTSFIYQARDNLRSLKSEYFKEIAMLDQQWKKDKRAQNVRLVQSEKQLEVLAMHEYIQRKSIELYPYQLSPRSSNRTRSARSVSAKNYPVCRIKKNQVSLKHSGRGKDAEKCGKIDGKIETELYLQRNSLSSHMQNKLSFYIKNNLLVDMIDFLDVQPTNVSVSPSLCPMTGPVLSLPILNLLVNSPDRNGMTPLFYAVLDGRTSLVRILLEQGANPNHKDLNKNTPMLLAAQAGNVPVVSLLLLFGGQLTKAAYLTKVGRHGKAVTNTGIANSKFTHQIWAYNAEVERLLPDIRVQFNHAAQPPARKLSSSDLQMMDTCTMATVIIGAIFDGCTTSVENVHVLFAELKTNLKRGESAGIANSLYMEKSVLWLACFHQRYEIAEILLQNGAEVNFSAWVPTQIQFSDLKDAMSKRRDNKVGENITAIDGCGEFLNENYPSSEIVDTNNSKMRKGINDNVEVLQSCLDVCLERQQYPITALLLRFQKDVKLAPLNSVIMDEQVLHRYMQLQQLSDMVKVAIRGKQYDRVFVIVCFETVKEGECWLHTNVKKRNANTASNKGSRKPILEVSEWCHECIRVSKRFQSSSATVIPKHLYILDEYAHCRAHLVVNFPDTMGKTALFHLASRSGGILDGTVVEKAEQSMSAFCPSEGPAGDNVSIFWKDSNKRMWMSDEEKRLARFLLHSGGNPFKLDRMGMTVVDTCLNRSNVDFLTILLQHDIDISISRIIDAMAGKIASTSAKLCRNAGLAIIEVILTKAWCDGFQEDSDRKDKNPVDLFQVVTSLIENMHALPDSTTLIHQVTTLLCSHYFQHTASLLEKTRELVDKQVDFNLRSVMRDVFRAVTRAMNGKSKESTQSEKHMRNDMPLPHPKFAVYFSPATSEAYYFFLEKGIEKATMTKQRRAQQDELSEPVERSKYSEITAALARHSAVQAQHWSSEGTHHIRSHVPIGQVSSKRDETTCCTATTTTSLPSSPSFSSSPSSCSAAASSISSHNEIIDLPLPLYLVPRLLWVMDGIEGISRKKDWYDKQEEWNTTGLQSSYPWNECVKYNRFLQHFDDEYKCRKYQQTLLRGRMEERDRGSVKTWVIENKVIIETEAEADVAVFVDITADEWIDAWNSLCVADGLRAVLAFICSFDKWEGQTTRDLRFSKLHQCTPQFVTPVDSTAEKTRSSQHPSLELFKSVHKNSDVVFMESEIDRLFLEGAGTRGRSSNGATALPLDKTSTLKTYQQLKQSEKLANRFTKMSNLEETGKKQQKEATQKPFLDMKRCSSKQSDDSRSAEAPVKENSARETTARNDLVVPPPPPLASANFRSGLNWDSEPQGNVTHARPASAYIPQVAVPPHAWPSFGQEASGAPSSSSPLVPYPFPRKTAPVCPSNMLAKQRGTSAREW